MTANDFRRLPLTGWFPGHMLRAGRQLAESLRLVDLIVELVDARAPASSWNPAFRERLQHKPVFLLATKADLADPERNRRWETHLREDGETVAFVGAGDLRRPDPLIASWRRRAEEHRRSQGCRLPAYRPLRVMVIGIPNVGKSTLVNRLSAGRRAAVSPKPGKTRHNQWVKLRGNVELLDTPGVLWPNVKDKLHELRLALLGSLKEEQVGAELLADYIWFELRRQPDNVDWNLYGLQGCPEHPDDLLHAVARRRGYLRAGGAIDRERSAMSLIKEFRDARLGRLTLEMPPDEVAPASKTTSRG